MNIFTIVDNSIAKCIKFITAFILFIQVLVIFLGVIFRYFLNNPLTWVDEFSCYLLVLLTFMGGYIAIRENKLARITMLMEKLPLPIRWTLTICSNLIILFLVFSIAYYGIKLAKMPAILNQKTPSMRVPMIVFYIFVPASGILMTFSMIIQTFNFLKNSEIDIKSKGEIIE